MAQSSESIQPLTTLSTSLQQCPLPCVAVTSAGLVSMMATLSLTAYVYGGLEVSQRAG